jgi:hypothetical protein
MYPVSVVLKRELVRKNHQAYQESGSSRFRADLAKNIRDQLLPGRFLKKDSANQEGFRVMDEDETLTKIMFSMRDCKYSKPIHNTWKAINDDDDDDQDQDDPNTSKELEDDDEEDQEMEEEDETSQGNGKQETNIEKEEDIEENEEEEEEDVYEDEPYHEHDFQYSTLGTSMT